MTVRAKTKDCPVCGRGFLKGKRCYVPTSDGRLIRKLVCLQCSQRAERIIVKMSANPCMTPGCSNLAHVCSHCAASMVLEVRQNAISQVVAQLRGVIAVTKSTVTEVGDQEAWNEGRIEGLRSALAMLLKNNEKKGSV